MVETNKKLPLGATPGKLVLVGVLAVVFVGVLIFQFGGMLSSSPATSGAAPGPAAPQVAQEAVVATSAPAKLPGNQKPRPQWSRVAIEEALAFDPFSVPPSLAVLLGPEPEPQQAEGVSLDEAAQLRAARLQETLNALRHHGVSMIFDKGQGPTATVGDQTLQIGDVIGGFRVVDISVKEGVVLEPLDDADESQDQANN